MSVASRYPAPLWRFLWWRHTDSCFLRMHSSTLPELSEAVIDISTAMTDGRIRITDLAGRHQSRVPEKCAQQINRTGRWSERSVDQLLRRWSERPHADDSEMFIVLRICFGIPQVRKQWGSGMPSSSCQHFELSAPWSLVGGLKTRDLKTQDGKNAGSKNAGLENAAPNYSTGKRKTGKCFHPCSLVPRFPVSRLQLPCLVFTLSIILYVGLLNVFE